MSTPRIGVLGGGQLGLMLAESLYALNADVAIYTPGAGSPAERRLADVTVADWDDAEALRAFFARCDAVTYESENIPVAPLRALPDHEQAKIRPGLHVLEIVQDRVEEKRFCQRVGLPTAAFRALEDISELPGAAAELGFPFILKTATGGYDGKGQWRVEGLRDLASLPPLRDHAPGRFVIEEVVDLVLEVSVVVGRRVRPDGTDVIHAFPVFENDHRDHILDVTILPARITPGQAEAAVGLAVHAAREIGAEGLLTAEFFLTRTAGQGRAAERDGLHLRVNEFAPRTHNSGHVTRRACSLSQFDQLARLLVGMYPAEPRLLPGGGFVMAQLLGEVWEAQGRSGALDLSVWPEHPDVLEVYQYGKEAVRTQRKMGHLIARGDDADAAESNARAFRDALQDGSGAD